MKIAVFSDSINIPPKEGINVHTYDLLVALAHRGDTAPTLVVCDRGWLNHDLLSDQTFDTILLPENLFYDRAFITEFLQRQNFDIVQSYMTYFGAVILGPAAYDVGVPVVAELHDLEASVVGVYFTDNELADAQQTHDSFQKTAADYASVVRIMSHYDASIIVETWPHYDENRYHWVPVAMNVHSAETPAVPDRVTYLGNMNYAPNAQGATILRDHVALHLEKPVTFVGRGSEAYASTDIKALGMIDDISPVLSETALGLTPILQGSGMKIKNLSYLSYGIPVLTTTLGAQGYPETTAIIIEDDFARWPHIINQILSDNDTRRKLSEIAKEYFIRHFEINTVTERLVDLYRQAIDTYEVLHPTLPVTDTVRVQAVDLQNVYWLRELREQGNKPVTHETHIKGRRT